MSIYTDALGRHKAEAKLFKALVAKYDKIPNGEMITIPIIRMLPDDCRFVEIGQELPVATKSDN